MAKLLGRYRNGNFDVTIFSDGTKVRASKVDEFIPEFPESMDINITNKCDLECDFCYASATNEGKHGDLLNQKFLDTIKPHTEIAINGNDLSHPDLMTFLQKMKERSVYVGMTVNQYHFMKNLECIKSLEKQNLIRGLGVSVSEATDDFIKSIKNFDTAVLHLVNGIVDKKTLDKLSDHDLKILLLGYKKLGRGEEYYSDRVKQLKNFLSGALESYIPKFSNVSFDNLALEQLNVKNLMSKEDWDRFYMGDDGCFTMYVDLVERTFSSSSVSLIKYPLTDDIIDMFNTVRKEKNENVSQIGKTLKQLERAGVSAKEEDGNYRDLTDITNDISERWGELHSEDK